MGIVIVFVVVDNPRHKDSIMDIRLPMFDKTNTSVQLIPYMQRFPFPFYIVLRHIEALPAVIADALRQWFEIVVDKQ